LKPEHTIATIETFGISISFNRDYFYMDPHLAYDVSSAENHIFNDDFEDFDKV
jgi:hypothetical protein